METLTERSVPRRFSRFESSRKGQSFILAGIEGVIVAMLAIYMIVAPDNARDHIRVLIGIVLIGAGCYQLQRGFIFYRANTHRTVVPLRFTGGAVLLFGGILIVLEKLTMHFNADAARIVLAATLIAAGAFGIAAGVLGRREGDFKIVNIIASAALIVLAGFYIWEIQSGEDKTRLLGIAGLVLALGLLGYAYLLRTQSVEPTPRAATTGAGAHPETAAAEPVSGFEAEAASEPPS